MKNLLNKMLGRKPKPQYSQQQIQRKVPLQLVYEFPTGEKLYTYRPEDLHLVCYHHEHFIKEWMNYIALYSVTKETVMASLDQIEACLDEIVERTAVGTNAAKAKTVMQFLRAQPIELAKAEQGLKEAMFCMFYILEDEPELTYNEFFNARKLELLSTVPLLKSEVFFWLGKITKDYLPTFEQNTRAHLQHLNALRQVEKDLAESSSPGSTTP